MADDKPLDVSDGMMTAAAGALVWTSGVYYLYCGAYQAPTVSLGEDDFIGTFKVIPSMPRSELFNRVRGTFINPDNYWQASDLPVIENATYEGFDGGEQITRDIEHAWIIDSYRGQRVNKIFLERSRLGMTLEAKTNLRGLKVGVGKTVSLNVPKLGWSGKVFMVERWTEADDGVEMVLREEVPGVYDWNYGEAITFDPAPNTDLPSAFNPSPPTDLILESGTDQLFIAGDGTVHSGIRASYLSGNTVQGGVRDGL